jgi:hypothetical protein
MFEGALEGVILAPQMSNCGEFGQAPRLALPKLYDYLNHTDHMGIELR